MEKFTLLVFFILSVYFIEAQSSPMWLLMNKHEQKLPPQLDFVNIFESKLDKINRYKHLQDLMQSAIVAIDKYEERIFDEIVALEKELPFLREARASTTTDQEQGAHFQPRTLVKNTNNKENKHPRIDIIPLRKRKNQLSVDLELQTLKDMLAAEEGRKRQNSHMGYSASRLFRAGRK